LSASRRTELLVAAADLRTRGWTKSDLCGTCGCGHRPLAVRAVVPDQAHGTSDRHHPPRYEHIGRLLSNRACRPPAIHANFLRGDGVPDIKLRRHLRGPPLTRTTGCRLVGRSLIALMTQRSFQRHRGMVTNSHAFRCPPRGRSVPARRLIDRAANINGAFSRNGRQCSAFGELTGRLRTIELGRAGRVTSRRDVMQGRRREIGTDLSRQKSLRTA
jgi:hypothetical protein